VVLDLESGDILWCEEGKRKAQVYNFMEYMGKDWMSHVEAVAMDMNAQYDSAFAERCPPIAVVYDIFHLVKLYNDTVLTAMRRRKQRELDESGDRLYKGSRYIVITDRRKLREKDRRARENNRMLNEISMKGLEGPPGTRMMHADNERRLDG
jgi:transposase